MSTAAVEKRNLSLDILRIFAAFLVLAVHTGQNTGVGYETMVGAEGVPLFFLMSGYWAMASYEKIVSKGGGWKEYYRDRIRRIVPLYYYCLILAYLKDIFYNARFYKVPWHEYFGLHGAGGIQYLRYFGFLQCLLPSENYDLWNNRYALWAMSSFALFYLLMPLIHKIAKGPKSALLLSFALMFLNKPMVEWTTRTFLPPFNDVNIAMQFPLNEIWVFMIGVSIYSLRNSKMKYCIGAIYLAIAFLKSFLWHPFELVFAAMMILLLDFPAEDYLADKARKVIEDISRMSFCLYLTHPMILGIVCSVTNRLFSYSHWMSFLAAFILCFILSWLNYQIFTFLNRILLKRKMA